MAGQVHITRVFAVDDPVPSDPRESWLTDPEERDRVTEYLRTGVPILMTTTLQPDRIDPARGRAVGASYRTDGSWVWSDALTYYARVYGLAPEDDFYQHIRANSYVCPQPSDTDQDRALSTLYASLRS